VGHRGVGPATASIEASLMAGDISHRQHKWYHLCWRTSYIDRQHRRFSGGGLHKPTASTNGPISAGGWLISTASRDLYYLATCICTHQHSEAENSLKLIQVINISTWTATTSQIQTEISTQAALTKVYFTQTTCMMTNVSKHT
jgi:hypothetical protein